MVLLGAFFPKTDDGTMVGITIAPAAAAEAFLRKVLRFMFI
jgi:hypothetical protein